MKDETARKIMYRLLELHKRAEADAEQAQRTMRVARKGYDLNLTRQYHQADGQEAGLSAALIAVTHILDTAGIDVGQMRADWAAERSAR